MALCPRIARLRGRTAGASMNTRRPRLFITRRMPERVMTALGVRFEITQPPAEESPTRDALRDGVRDADGLLATLSEQINRDVLAAGPNLKIIANCAVGFNNIALDEARARGIVVTNTPDILTEATADL